MINNYVQFTVVTIGNITNIYSNQYWYIKYIFNRDDSNMINNHAQFTVVTIGKYS